MCSKINKKIGENVFMEVKKFHGFKMQYFTYTILGVSVLCGCLFFYFVFRLIVVYDSFMSNVTDYTESTKAISEFRDTSDFLTNQARLFTAKQDSIFLDNYLHEVEKLKTRENSIDVIKMTHNQDDVITNVSMAYNESQYIQSIELYAMKIICLANGVDISKYGEILEDILISDSIMQKEESEQVLIAQEFLFASDYLIAKERLFEYCEKANRELVYSFLEKKDDMNSFFINRFSLLIFSVLILFISITLFSVMVIFLLIRPIKSYTKSILVGLPIKKVGSEELQRLVHSYNKLCQNYTEKANVLRHKAEHDPLTDLINRAGFDEIKNVLREYNEPVAYLLIDVDFFKQINDVYGHQTGDLVLKRISKMLSEQFRKTDYVARVGGDEFAVIMTKFGNSPTEIIKSKIENMNNLLQTVVDGLPAISLSVGVAFSEEGFVDSLVEQADSALYKVKKGGRCNCSFYEEIES